MLVIDGVTYPNAHAAARALHPRRHRTMSIRATEYVLLHVIGKPYGLTARQTGRALLRAILAEPGRAHEILKG